LRQRKAVCVAVGLMALLVMTSCFQIRGYYFTKRVLRPGENVTLVLDMRPLGTFPPPHKVQDFFILGFREAGDTGKGIAKVGGVRIWDAKGAFNGPKTMVLDNALRNQVTNSDDCIQTVDFESAGLTDVIWTAFRPPGPVDDKDKATKTALTKIRIKAREDLPVDSVVDVFVVNGFWEDSNENGVADDEESACAGLLSTSLPTPNQ
jgi:hypothetical protein